MCVDLGAAIYVLLDATTMHEVAEDDVVVVVVETCLCGMAAQYKYERYSFRRFVCVGRFDG